MCITLAYIQLNGQINTITFLFIKIYCCPMHLFVYIFPLVIRLFAVSVNALQYISIFTLMSQIDYIFSYKVVVALLNVINCLVKNVFYYCVLTGIVA